MNTLEQIPLLQVQSTSGDSFNISQSVAIIEYIEEEFGQVGLSLLPKDKLLRAKIRQIVEIINSGIQPLHNLSVLRQVKSVELIDPKDSEEGNANTMAKKFIEKGFRAIESVLAEFRQNDSTCSENSKTFAMGTFAPTLADVFLIPQVFAAMRFSVDIASYPNIYEVFQLAESWKAFQDAAPTTQPDAPKA